MTDYFVAGDDFCGWVWGLSERRLERAKNTSCCSRDGGGKDRAVTREGQVSNPSLSKYLLDCTEEAPGLAYELKGLLELPLCLASQYCQNEVFN